MSSKSKRQRVDLTWAEKKQICEVHKEKPSFSHSELAKYMVEHHGFRLVNRSTISRTLEESSRWLEVSPNVREGKTKRVRDAKWPQVDKATLLWLAQIRARSGVINDAMLVDKASEFRDLFGISREDFKLSHGWLEKFKSRHGIMAHTVTVDAARVLAILETYDPEDVYNFDETNLYYKTLPNVDDRVILGLCANMSGHDRLKMIFLHRVARPRCFPTAFDPNMLVHFYANRHAWMNGDVFTNWVTGENKRMASLNRRILILLDNAASHIVDGVRKTTINELDAFVLSNITLVFSVRQPWDHGVFAAMKLAYRRKLMAASCQVDLLQCMLWVVAAWNELDAEYIKIAWRLSGLLAQDPHFELKSRKVDEVALTEDPITASEYFNEVDIEAEYSTQQIVDLVAKSGNEVDRRHDDEEGDDAERVPIEVAEARLCGYKLLDFTLASSSFSSSELLSVERICDKISRKCAPPFTDSHQYWPSNVHSQSHSYLLMNCVIHTKKIRDE